MSVSLRLEVLGRDVRCKNCKATYLPLAQIPDLDLAGDRGARRCTAELHKLLGCLSLAFNVIIAVTGIMLTLGIIGTRAWFGSALLHAAEGGEALPMGAALQGVDSVIQRGAAMQPGRSFFSFTYPGSLQGPNFYFCGGGGQSTKKSEAPAFNNAGCLRRE